MAGKIIVQPNQSMSDVIIQATGSMEACVQFCKDNHVSASDIPVVGTEYVVTDTALLLGDESVLEFFEQHKIVIGTLGNAGIVGYITEDGSETYIGEDGVTYIEE